MWFGEGRGRFEGMDQPDFKSLSSSFKIGLNHSGVFSKFKVNTILNQPNLKEMIEIHPFNYYSPKDADKLIIGSFPCYNGNDYGDWFYRGSGRNDFWKLLSDIFHLPVETKEQMMELCDINHIAITDIAYKIERTQDSCKDSDLKIIEYNADGITTCLTQNIKHLLFTSKFVEKHFKMVYPNSVIQSTVLLSPSPSASIYIGSLPEYKDMVRQAIINSTYDYRLLKYRSAFNNEESSNGQLKEKVSKKELVVKHSIIPDWGKCRAIVLVYPYKMKDREYLMPFYDKLLAYIPKDIKIILVVRNLSFSKEYRQKCLNKGVTNELEFIEIPQISDIWIRDYAPLTLTAIGRHFPVKFEYSPSYIEEKYAKYIQADNEAGRLIGEKCIDKGEFSLYFRWDMGNLTHNGKGTAIITNRLIKDNENVGVDHELRGKLHVFIGLSNIIFIPVEPDDETGHVDGMVRFIDDKVVVIGAYPTGSKNHMFMEILASELKTDLGDDYTVIRLMNAEPEDYISEGISSAVGNHVNFLRINDHIFFPYYSDEISKQPLLDFRYELEKINLPIQIIPVDIPEITELARKGGVLNCISWQVFA